MDTLLPGIGAERDSGPTVSPSTCSPIPDRTGPAVLFAARQRVVLAVLAADDAGAARSSTGRWPSTCAASATPMTSRSTPPGGCRDFSDNLAAAVEALGLDRVHLVELEHGRRGGAAVPDGTAGHGCVADAGEPGLAVRASSRDQGRGRHPVRPVGPVGSGGGRAANPEFRGAAGRVRTGRTKARCRRGRCCCAHYVKPPHMPEHLDIYGGVDVLSTPDRAVARCPRRLWPGGRLAGLRSRRPRRAQRHGPHPLQDRRPVRGGLPSRRCSGHAAPTTSSSPTPPLCNLAYLGSLGAIPGWPGEQTWPPQPMVAQTRAVLNGYAVGRGRVPRGGHRGRGSRPAPGPAGAVPGRADGAPRRRLTRGDSAVIR